MFSFVNEITKITAF